MTEEANAREDTSIRLSLLKRIKNAPNTVDKPASKVNIKGNMFMISPIKYIRLVKKIY